MQPPQPSTVTAGSRRCGPGRALAAAALFVLGGCTGTGSGAGVVYFTSFTAGYAPRSLAAAHPVLVQTYGSPAPDLPQQSVTQATVQALRASGPSWMPRGYTGNPEDAPRPAYRIHIAYGAPKAFNRQGLCNQDMSVETLEAARGADEAETTRTMAKARRALLRISTASGSPTSSACSAAS